MVPIEVIAIEDEIIVDYDYMEFASTTAGPDDIADLIGALDDIP